MINIPSSLTPHEPQPDFIQGLQNQEIIACLFSPSQAAQTDRKNATRHPFSSSSYCPRAHSPPPHIYLQSRARHLPRWLHLAETTSSMSSTQLPDVIPPPPGSSAWHVVPRHGSPAVMVGTIGLPGGTASFLHPAESRAAQPVSQKLDAQPAQFPYRTDWTHWDGPLRETRAGSKEERSRLRIDEDIVPRRTKIQTLGASPLDAWLPSPPGTTTQQLSQLLDLKVSPNTCLNESAFIVGLQFATYYAARDVLVASAALSCHKPPIRNPPAGSAGHVSAFSDDAIIPGTTLEDMQLQSRLGYKTNKSLQQAQFDKQFTVIPIHHNVGPGHWTMAVFDRRVGHLLYWDPLQPRDSDDDYALKLASYKERTRSSIVAFTSYLTFNAQPSTFRVTVCSVTGQRGSFECGHILCEIARQLFSGQTGLSHGRYISMMQTSPLGLPMEIPTHEQDKQVYATDLRLRDWVTEPFRCDDSAKTYWEHYNRMIDEWKVAIFGFLGSGDCTVEMIRDRELLTLKLKALRRITPYWLTSRFEADPLSLEAAAFPHLGGRAHSVLNGSLDVVWYPYDRNFKLDESMRSQMLLAGHAKFKHPLLPKQYPEPVIKVSNAAMEFLSRRGWHWDDRTLTYAHEPSEEEGKSLAKAKSNFTHAVSISSSNSSGAVARDRGTADQPRGRSTTKPCVAAAADDARSSVCDNQLSNSVSQMSLDTGHRPSSALGSIVGNDDADVYMEDAAVQDSGSSNGSTNLPSVRGRINGALTISRLDMQGQMIEAGRAGMIWSAGDEATRDMLLLSEELGLMPFPGADAQIVGNAGNTFVLEDMPSNLISHTQDWPRLVDCARRQVTR
ncbi:hypothetical protein FPOAC1_003870 [Fusarium poae]|uniref:hypothetical protein n=1 Tax=Fusarium poae TaxID=36050 RepID=UPI001CE833C7|nr:hypothetical protein FPOAC1_003870 [Fusarium poae]KAG8677842.1 hypothetical protein FPOAC1_003870 [Fusarium poae]